MKIEGNIVDIVNKRTYKGEITILNGKISAIRECETDHEQFIIPGFIDAHVHVESSMLIPSEFARMAVCHGSVATISDPHEIGNVLGKGGVEYMVNNGFKTPFKFHFGAPSCVPATIFETAGAEITLDDIEEIFQLPRVNYLAEMMNFPGVLNRDPEVMAKINLAIKLGKQVDGHAPGLMGEDAKRYIDAGITTDHECFSKPEAVNKLNHGMKIIIREGSAAKNFEALWSLIDEFPEDVMLCSDDKHPNDLAVGHINDLARRAVSKGCDVFNVLRAASYNPIKHYKMDVGLLQLNDPADFCIVNNLVDFKVGATYIDGNLVAQNGKTRINSIKEEIVNNFSCSEIGLEQLRVDAQSTNVQVICVEDGQLITTKEITELTVVDGALVPNVAEDILKIAVVNRYEDAPPALGFVKNFGLKHGAIASCVAHDSHNIIAVGTNDKDLCEAINAIVREKGGVSLANGDEVSTVALPVAGIMSNLDGYEVAEAYEKLDLRSKELGVTLAAPYMTLSFCALLVIPKLKLSDKGLFDGEKFCFTSIYVD
ncbi:MAG: adenine deaminase [Crocinitomicaceae bacterium]|nr:adenine deaminase [Crocinitomicaceae bacterium]MDG1658493.1 adenine deaminase [Crocinitomicaceae bacterium]|tara:strand:- start:4095 stop:5717 length:1623 start_codon:yes stop_codon:yes gene_type:complete